MPLVLLRPESLHQLGLLLQSLVSISCMQFVILFHPYTCRMFSGDVCQGFQCILSRKIGGLPYAIDRSKARSKNNSVDMDDLIVDLHDGCKTANLRSGPLKLISIPLVASNFSQKQEDRLLCIYIYNSGCHTGEGERGISPL